MGIDQQHTIHRKVDDDVRKIILSTNIAESSLTVPNVRYGKTRVKFDFKNKTIWLFRIVPI